MESKTTYEDLLLEIAKQEEIIDGYFREAEEKGNIDPSFEEYLNQAKLELQKKREEVIKQQETTKNTRSSQNIKVSNDQIKPEEKTPKIKRSKTAEFEEKVNPKNKYPFYSIKNIELQKPKQRSSSAQFESNQNINPVQIFKKPSYTRSNDTSPSARRYESSPKEVLCENVVDDVYTPVTQRKKIPVIQVDQFKEVEENSPDLMLKRAISDISNISSFLNDKDIEDKLETFQWYRELKNSAHEKMLELKEQILMEKANKLQNLIKSIPEEAKSNYERLKAKTKAKLPPLSPKRNEEILVKSKTSPQPRDRHVKFQVISHNKSRSNESSPINNPLAYINRAPPDNSNNNPNNKTVMSKHYRNAKSMNSIKKEDKIVIIIQAELVSALPGIPSEIASRLVKNINITHN